jgi:hypothetical protein
MRPALAALQTRFQDYLLDRAGDTSTMLPAIRDDYGLAAPERLAIYHDAYRLRIRDALSETYDKTHIYLGEELFYRLAVDYLDAHPSTFRNLRWFGAHFPAYLSRKLPEHPEAAELAAFEWALELAFDAPDQPVLHIDALRTLQPQDWETLGFSCPESLQVLALRSNAVAIWQALSDEQHPPPAAFAATAQSWLIWRKQLQPHFRSANVAECAALRGLREGQSFSEVCALAADTDADIAPQIAGWLQQWLGDEMLAGLRQ